MENIINKLSRYHIFNYLVPGALFIIICDWYLNIHLCNDGLLNMFFMAYFIGIVISRISSLCVEKCIYHIFKINRVPYDIYIQASKIDNKIDVLMQDGNMYRSLCTMVLMLLIIQLFKLLNLFLPINKNLIITVLLILLLVLFIGAYIKQNRYIIKRVKCVTTEQSNKLK